jgi:hypothetical protein
MEPDDLEGTEPEAVEAEEGPRPPTCKACGKPVTDESHAVHLVAWEKEHPEG